MGRGQCEDHDPLCFTWMPHNISVFGIINDSLFSELKSVFRIGRVICRFIPVVSRDSREQTSGCLLTVPMAHTTDMYVILSAVST